MFPVTTGLSGLQHRELRLLTARSPQGGCVYVSWQVLGPEVSSANHSSSSRALSEAPPPPAGSRAHLLPPPPFYHCLFPLLMGHTMCTFVILSFTVCPLQLGGHLHMAGFLFCLLIYPILSTQNSISGEESSCQGRRCRFDPWVGKLPWRRKWQPTPVFLPGKFHEELQRSLVSISPWGCKRVGHN